MHERILKAASLMSQAERDWVMLVSDAYDVGREAAAAEIVSWLRDGPDTCPCVERGGEPCHFSTAMTNREMADDIAKRYGVAGHE